MPYISSMNFYFILGDDFLVKCHFWCILFVAGVVLSILIIAE